MYVVHATAKLLARLPTATLDEDALDETRLGPWYATIGKGRPQIAVLVSATTLLPVLMPLALARTLLKRFPAALERVLLAHGVPTGEVAVEVAAMSGAAARKTASRSLVGVLNEFVLLTDRRRGSAPDDVVGWSLELARTPCSPLYSSHVSPDRELAALFGLQSR